MNIFGPVCWTTLKFFGVFWQNKQKYRALKRYLPFLNVHILSDYYLSFFIVF